jgi:hypothetical protein
MTSPLADEEELLRLIMEGLSQKKIAEMKGVSKQAVGQRLSRLRPVLEERGIEIHKDRRRLSLWVPWTIGETRWRYHHTVKMLRLLGRKYDGPKLDEAEERQLQRFLKKLDNMPSLPSGRGVVTYRGPDIGPRIVDRLPWDRGYVRWPDDRPDERALPPDLVLPDEPYEDPHELRIWKLTDLTKEERHARIVALRATRSGDPKKNAV